MGTLTSNGLITGNSKNASNLNIKRETYNVGTFARNGSNDIYKVLFILLTLEHNCGKKIWRSTESIYDPVKYL